MANKPKPIVPNKSASGSSSFMDSISGNAARALGNSGLIKPKKPKKPQRVNMPIPMPRPFF